MDNAMSKQPDNIIDEEQFVKVENRIIEECALTCLELIGDDWGSRKYAIEECVEAIRKLKKQEDSGDCV